MKTFLEPLTPDEEKIYIEKMRLGDKKAKDILIERNLRLVAHVVKKYYDENKADLSRPYHGIYELLKTLQKQGIMIAVASNIILTRGIAL